MKKRTFTTGEIAGILGVSRVTVHRWVKTGELKGFRSTPKAYWRIAKKELVTFMLNNKIPLDLLEEGEKIKVLVVDDEVNLTEAIYMAFQNEERFIFESANSGFNAGLKLESFHPDILILDIVLEDIDGRELFKHIEENPGLNGLKVIGISGILDQPELESLLELGFHAYLQKPFEMKELKKTILAVIKKEIGFYKGIRRRTRLSI